MGDTRPVRPGEEVPLDALNALLAVRAPDVGQVLAVRQFPSGFSNLTYLLTTEVGELVLRRPPRGVATGSAHDMAREHRILTVLAMRAIPAPQPVLLCEDASVIGAPFYLMERVEGLILRGDIREPPPADAMRRLSESFVETLVAIHAIDAGDPDVGALGRGEGYVARQVTGWTRRWEGARTDAVPQVERVASWLAAHQPADSAAVLVHNDYKYDNLVLEPAEFSRVRAVLDWEMATLGDPLLDVGTALGYWVEVGDHPALRSLGLGATALPGNFTRVELWDWYIERSGRRHADPVFYYVFGLFKIAVIAQQIFYRFRQGLTSDERFSRLGEAVQLLATIAEAAVARGSMAPVRAAR